MKMIFQFVYVLLFISILCSCARERYRPAPFTYSDTAKIKNGTLIFIDTINKTKEFKKYRHGKLNGKSFKINHESLTIYKYRHNHLIRIYRYDANYGYVRMWNFRFMNMNKPKFTIRNTF
ncbi:MAG: hypothetical protein KG003_15475 [Bacteroidetes bacterium]|nr:hypothetical protein [Bacteroidota bacterium]